MTETAFGFSVSDELSFISSDEDESSWIVCSGEKMGGIGTSKTELYEETDCSELS